MPTQMNFGNGGVKAASNVATCGQAEKGEATRPLHAFVGEKGPGHTVRSGPMMNFGKGS